MSPTAICIWEVPISTLPQRGNLQLSERLVYDSRIWMIGHYSNKYWWPNNVPGSMAGWRFVNGLETGSIGLTVLNSSVTECANGLNQNNATFAISYSDPAGTNHITSAILAQDTQDCQTGGTVSSVESGKCS